MMLFRKFKKNFAYLLGFGCSLTLSAQQPANKNILSDILKKYPTQFAKITEKPDNYRVQILYTQIDRDVHNRPKFTSHAYRVNPEEYFYPASTVKFPACLLALEKLNGLNIKDLNRKSIIHHDSAFAQQSPVVKDPTAPDGLPTIEHYIKKILMVSDNDAFNRLYEFMGQEAFNDNLFRKGHKNTRIVHRLELPFNTEQNRRSNPIRCYHPIQTTMDTPSTSEAGTYVRIQKKLLFEQSMLINPKKLIPDAPIFMGMGEMIHGKIVYAPKDFKTKNCFPIEEQQNILKAILFPEAVAPEMRFNLTNDDYSFLYKYMSQLPRESQYPKYDTSYYDSYCKFLMFGDTKKPIPKNIRIFNKVGDAYGFLIDNAYIVDFDKNIEFMLTVCIYVNSDGIFNDDKYDYDTIGYPFMANLGKAVYEYELTRPRKNVPNLNRFKVAYDK
ncbi:MAG: hypothetical protein RIS64_2955 [Bacteroidota bacterium]|jgi:hypothetical protein